MGVTSKQETIMEYIRETTMVLIDGTGNYNLKLNLISRDYRHAGQLGSDNFPAVFILDEYRTPFTAMTARGYTTGTSIGDVAAGWIMGLLGFVQIDTDMGLNEEGPLSQEMNKMMSDLMIAMADDPTFGGNAEDSLMLDNDKSLEYAENSIGVVLQLYSIKVDFSPANAIT